MKKVFGATERHDGLTMFSHGAVLIFGYGEEDGYGYDYRHTFTHRPTKEELIDVITTHVNALTDEKILTGYVWNGISVWLSRENQFNFKAAYDVAVQSDGAILPINFKLGEDKSGNPLYYTFANMDEFEAFYTGAIVYIQQTLADGWAEKDRARELFG